MTGTNWAANLTYRAAALHRPASLEQVQELVAGASRLRVLGSRHSFNDIADADELLSLDRLPADVVVDHAAGTVSCSGAVRYGELAEALAAEGVALANLASLPHITVAGAVATATHAGSVQSCPSPKRMAGMSLRMRLRVAIRRPEAPRGSRRRSQGRRA